MGYHQCGGLNHRCFRDKVFFANDFFIILRQKVDLTKYIEQHSFHFDATYNDNVSNQDVSNTPSDSLILLALLGHRSTIGQLSFQRSKSQLFCIWINWIWKNIHHDGWRLWRCSRTLSFSNKRYFCITWKTVVLRTLTSDLVLWNLLWKAVWSFERKKIISFENGWQGKSEYYWNH